MKISKIILMLLFTNFIFNSITVSAQEKFHLSAEKEISILSLSSALTLTSHLLEKKISINPAEIYSLNKNDINLFDRSAVNFYSKKISLASDVFMLFNVSLPITFIFLDEAKNDLKEIAIMYLETLTLTYGVTNLTKNIFQRFRPYAYNHSVELSEKLDPDTKKSFFSGHTSISFASAVFFSTVFSEISSDENAKRLVWIGSISLATTTGLLRYFSGKHFPTDILAGALAGSLIGYTIPYIHKSERNVNFNFLGYQNIISFNLNFDSRIFR
jgi:membrane-associated phospholipid phosphatase